jgi:hypothetical protein
MPMAADSCRHPPIIEDADALVALMTPFVCYTEIAGSLPHGLPRSLHELESRGYIYGDDQPLAELCTVGGDDDVESDAQLRSSLLACERAAIPFWLSMRCPAIQHPAWWPLGSCSVPEYNSLIVGSGASGIGMHYDCHNAQPVCTYLSLGLGRKRVLLLPPTEAGTELALKRFGGRDPRRADHSAAAASTSRVRAMPARPPLALLNAVAEAGGYFFDLVADDAAGRAATLFLPRGWWHWVEGGEDCEWHVAWGGSFYSD